MNSTTQRQVICKSTFNFMADDSHMSDTCTMDKDNVNTHVDSNGLSSRLEPSAPPLSQPMDVHVKVAVNGTEPIISEVLCFISNKINIVPYDMLLKLCVDYYDNEDIDLGKDVLYNTVPGDDNIRRRIHRGEEDQ